MTCSATFILSRARITRRASATSPRLSSKIAAPTFADSRRLNGLTPRFSERLLAVAARRCRDLRLLFFMPSPSLVVHAFSILHLLSMAAILVRSRATPALTACTCGGPLGRPVALSTLAFA